MLVRDADARCADLFDADAHALDLARRHLIERQAVALQHDAVRVDEEEREIVLLEKLAAREVIDRVLVLRLQRAERLRRETVRRIHFLRADAELATLAPRLRHPRMHVRIEHTLLHEFLVVVFQFFPAAMFPDHPIFPFRSTIVQIPMKQGLDPRPISSSSIVFGCIIVTFVFFILSSDSCNCNSFSEKSLHFACKFSSERPARKRTML